jgi:hypothetical protein
VELAFGLALLLAVGAAVASESVAVVAEHSIGGSHLTRVLDQICYQRGRPR